jgi:ComEC/Rec2-related protein
MFGFIKYIKEIVIAAAILQLFLLNPKTINAIGKQLEWGLDRVVKHSFSFTTQQLHHKVGQTTQIIGKLTNQNVSVTTLFSTAWQVSDAVDNGQFVLNYQEKGKNQVRTASVKAWKEKVFEVVTDAKIAFIKTVETAFAEPFASLINGMVFGGTSSLPTDLQHQLKIIGMQHVVSASGYNVALMIGIAETVLSRFSRFKRTGLSLGLVGMYAVMADLTPSILRASLMASFSLVGRQWGLRQYQAGWGLTLTVFFLLLWDRTYLTSISFQLSIAATLGIMVFTPVFTAEGSYLSNFELGIENKPLPAEPGFLKMIVAPFREAALVSSSAQILALPLVWHHFGEVNAFSLITNTFLLWLTPVITLGGLLFLAIAVPLRFVPIMPEVVTQVVAVIVWLPTQLFIWGVAWFGQFEAALWRVPPLPWWQVVCWWVIALSWGWWRGRQRHFISRVKKPVFCFYV